MTHLKHTFAALAVIAMPTLAAAGPITWGPDTYDPPNVYFEADGEACTQDDIEAVCESFGYMHDLTAYGFVPGASSADQLTGGLLELVLRDDDADNPSEGFKIVLEGLLQPGTHNAEVDFSFGGFSAAILTSLQLDGALNVLLKHQHGDFVLDRSTFTAYGTRERVEDAADVPEPATMLLWGLGTAWLAGRRRAQRARRRA